MQVSVIIPAFDAGGVIKDAVQSVISQTWTDWELLIVDDGTSNGSDQMDVLLQWAADPRIHVLVTSGRQGAGPARNLGMKAAKGRYIAFLDADDIWHPKKLALQLAMMQSSGAVLSCTALTRVNLTTGHQSSVGVPALITRQDLLRTNVIACSSAIFDRDHYGSKQMPALRRRQDFAFWLELMSDGSMAIGVPYPLLNYRETPVSLSSCKRRAARDTWWMYRHHLGMSMLGASYYFCHYAVRGVVRRFCPSMALRLGWMQPVRQIPQA